MQGVGVGYAGESLGCRETWAEIAAAGSSAAMSGEEGSAAARAIPAHIKKKEGLLWQA